MKLLLKFVIDLLILNMTQEYKREIVYSGYSITSISPDCSYLNYNLREKRLILFCEEINDDNYNIGYETILEPLNKRKVETLPIKCGKKFSGIEQNIAFFLFFSLCIVNIIATIFLCTTDLKQYLSKALDNDNIILLEEFGKKITNKGNEFKTESKNKNLSHIFVKNLSTLHPLFSLCSPSVLCPLYFNIGIFFNEIINILGWNSVFFSEEKIEKRIYDNKRDYFVYPFVKEFDRIFVSILTSIVFTVLLKVMNLITYERKESLSKLYKDDIPDDIDKEKGKLRFISYIIMTFFWAFFWYYCTIFCSMYVNAQYDWLYSSIWSLMLIYFLFSPVYILVISILDFSGFEVTTFYMKRLFIF